MPTYDYQCQACGHEFEEFAMMSAKPLRRCPECKKLKLKRLIGMGAGVIFKGSGFYQTDYRSEGYKKAAEIDKKAAEGKSEKSDSGKKSESGKKSDSKTPSANAESTSKPKSDKPKSG